MPSPGREELDEDVLATAENLLIEVLVGANERALRSHCREKARE